LPNAENLAGIILFCPEKPGKGASMKLFREKAYTSFWDKLDDFIIGAVLTLASLALLPIFQNGWIWIAVVSLISLYFQKTRSWISWGMLLILLPITCVTLLGPIVSDWVFQGMER
jgi:hypothetical protein